MKGRRAALVLIGVEKRGTTSGRVRLAVIPDFKAKTLTGFIKHRIGAAGDLPARVSGGRLLSPHVRVFNGVDVTVSVRAAHGFTLSSSTSTGKVVNDWCDIRAAVPEGTYAGVSGLLNPYCCVESPVQTSFRALATYTIPRIDVLVSSVFQDKPNVGTDQLVSLLANYTLTAADQASLSTQIGRPLMLVLPAFTVAHYHRERNHQGIHDRLIAPDWLAPPGAVGPIRCRARLGGLLRYYHRAA